jgi:hypothetical protein
MRLTADRRYVSVHERDPGGDNAPIVVATYRHAPASNAQLLEEADESLSPKPDTWRDKRAARCRRFLQRCQVLASLNIPGSSRCRCNSL